MPAEEEAILAWTDEESTGLSLDDHVLEVAVVFTDSNLRELGSFETLVRPQPSTFARIHADPIVAQMHRSSGLLAELEANADTLPTLDEVEEMFLEEIGRHAGADRLVMMAGGGVSHFDIGHLGHWMPRLGHRLHYGTVDISDVVRGYVAATRNLTTFAKPSVKAHRAMADVREELAIAPLIWDMYQQYDSRRFAGVQSSPVERVLAGASLIQAASAKDTDRELNEVLDELSARDAIAGVTVVATKLLEMLTASTGKSGPALLDELRMGALR